MLWHQCLGHMSEKYLKILQERGMLSGIKYCNLELCEHYIFGKKKRVWFTASFGKSYDFLQRIHFDIFGLVPTQSINGARYFLTLLDDYSRSVWVYFLKNKSESFEKFKEFKERLENSLGKSFLHLRSYNGGEYCSEEFDKFCV